MDAIALAAAATTTTIIITITFSFRPNLPGKAFQYLLLSTCSEPTIPRARLSYPLSFRYRLTPPPPVWPDLTKFLHFGKISGNFSGVYLLFGTISNLLWQILYTFGQIFIDVNGKMLQNNLAIWSHWLLPLPSDGMIATSKKTTTTGLLGTDHLSENGGKLSTYYNMEYKEMNTWIGPTIKR